EGGRQDGGEAGGGEAAEDGAAGGRGGGGRHRARSSLSSAEASRNRSAALWRNATAGAALRRPLRAGPMLVRLEKETPQRHRGHRGRLRRPGEGRAPLPTARRLIDGSRLSPG